MRLKPHVDAFNMEAMVAFREQPSFLAGDKLRQADSTFQTVLELFRTENQYGYGAKNGGIEASAIGGQSRVLAGGEDEGGPPAAAAAGTCKGAASVGGSPPEPFGVEMKKDNKDDDEEENDDGYHHNLAAKLHGGGVVQGGRFKGVPHVSTSQ